MPKHDVFICVIPSDLNLKNEILQGKIVAINAINMRICIKLINANIIPDQKNETQKFVDEILYFFSPCFF